MHESEELRRSGSNSIRRAIRRGSAKTFAVRLWPFDFVLSVGLSLLAGASAYLTSPAEDGSLRVLSGVVSAVSAFALVLLLRALVPVVLRLSFADMLRVRVPFFTWLIGTVVVFAFAAPVRRLYSACDASSVLMTLLLLSAAFAIRFLQTGSFFRLSAAIACVGAAAGLSVLGVVAAGVFIVILRLLMKRLFTRDSYGWHDHLKSGVHDYHSNPLVRSRMKWIFVYCFLGGLGLGFVAGPALPVEDGMSGLGAWVDGLNPDGLAVLLLLAALPLQVVLHRVNHVSNAAEHPHLGELLPHLAVGAVSALLLVRIDVIDTLLSGSVGLGYVLSVDDRIKVGVLVVCAYDVLLAAMVMMVDIRCRNFSASRGVSKGELRSQMRFSFSLMTAAPLCLAGVIAFLAVRPGEADGVSAPVAKDGARIRMTLTCKEALRVVLDRKDLDLAVRHAESVLAECPDDAEALALVVRAYEARGSEDKAASVRKRLEDLRR